MKLGISAGNGCHPSTDEATRFARCLQHTPHLRKLDLALRNLLYLTPTSVTIFATVANDVYLPRLEECRLSGFGFRDDGSIREFLTRHAGTLQRIFLADMDMRSGSWELALSAFHSRKASPAFQCAQLSHLSVRGFMTYNLTTVITRSESGEMEERIGWV